MQIKKGTEQHTKYTDNFNGRKCTFLLTNKYFNRNYKIFFINVKNEDYTVLKIQQFEGQVSRTK